jgi:hypothetical protein
VGITVAVLVDSDVGIADPVPGEVELRSPVEVVVTPVPIEVPVGVVVTSVPVEVPVVVVVTPVPVEVPVGVVVTPVPVEVPAVGVIPDTVSDVGVGVPSETSEEAVTVEVGVSDVGMAMLVSVVGTGYPEEIPVEKRVLMSGIGKGV